MEMEAAWSLVSLVSKHYKGKVHLCTGSEALYSPYGP